MAKGTETGTHVTRFANRTGARWRQFVKDAAKPPGVITADRIALDFSQAASDMVTLWAGLLGFGASPQVGVADFGTLHQPTWKAGTSTALLLGDAVDPNAQWPTGAGGTPTLKLAPIDGGATVNLQLTGVDVLEDGLQLNVSVKDVTAGGGFVAPGEYYANLYYQLPGNPQKFFAALIRGVVVL